MMAFVTWCACGFLMVSVGVYAFFAKKAIGFWANVKPVDVTDVRGYNRAIGRLLCIGGLIFILLGLPLLRGQNTAGILFSILGVVFGSIAMMIVYTAYIERKYKKK